MKKIILYILLQVLLLPSFAQTNYYNNDVKTPHLNKFAFVHATVFIDAKIQITDATLLVEDGKIKQCGKGIVVPKDYHTIDVTGKYIYPSFIDIYSSYGMPVKKVKDPTNNQFNSNKPGPYNQNEAIRPETNASELFDADEKTASQLRNLGFGCVVTHNMDGIIRGTGSLVTLAKASDNKVMVSPIVNTNYSFNKGSSTQMYPGSLMGAIALLRQTNYDASWYQVATKKETDLSLEYYNKTNKLPKIFDAGNKWNVFRAAKIALEFGQKYIYKTDGGEYQRLEDLKNLGCAVITPLNFQLAFKTDNIYVNEKYSLMQLLQWQMSPYNPYLLDSAKIEFCFTIYDLKNKSDFYKNLKKAVAYGLPASQALNALTQNPAKMMGIENTVGNLQNGKLANFIICTDTLFGERFQIIDNIIQGEVYNNESYLKSQSKTEGIYSVIIENRRHYVQLKNKNGTFILNPELNQLTVKVDSQKITGKVSVQFYYNNNAIKGSRFCDAIPDSARPDKVFPRLDLPKPFIAFGNNKLPEAKNYHIKNITIYTAESDGVLYNTDIIIASGKIKEVGKNVTCTNCETVDGTGKYLTPGIIDEHSHIAISGDVNEPTQSVTSEVRIGDVVFPEDINIYRQLSGGVTSSHLLHGSANCIGGQTQLIKMRWGENAEAMKFEGWAGQIKFALGENVKQSNWGEHNMVRYPQTRMGVEQTMVDAFTRAIHYKMEWVGFNLNSDKYGLKPRRDLELDALVEIMDKKRFITCHSYVQSEINMLMHVADSFGFKVNTFTHILEGYKVADKMKKHGAAASTFADWWAYKYEVMEAIPYNAAILYKMDVTTSVNSDDAEMARRLNQEAAKSMKYGNLSDTQVIKMCTINPAKMLHIDHKTGSIKVGKDADVVIWNNNPLSIYGVCQKTFVDGKLYYDIDQQQSIMSQQKWLKQQILKNMETYNKESKETPSTEGAEMEKEAYSCGHE